MPKIMLMYFSNYNNSAALLAFKLKSQITLYNLRYKNGLDFKYEVLHGLNVFINS